jgi:hypothetical protein
MEIFMAMSNDRSLRRGRRAAPTLEAIEERILLSHGAIASPPKAETVLIEAAKRHRLTVNGKLTGSFTAQTADGVNFLVTVTGQGSSGNRKIGQITIQSSFVTTLAYLTSISTQNTTVPGLPFQLTASGGSMTAEGTLSITPKSKHTPFRITANVTGGTGQFAGAAGNFTLQGTKFSLASDVIAARLRGTIVTTS